MPSGYGCVYWTRSSRPARLDSVAAGTGADPGRSEKVFAAYVIITVVTIVANAWVAVADLTRAGFVLANMAEVGVRRSWLVPLGVLKGAGAVGLLVGLLGLRPLGVAAAIGLVLFFAGALAVHVRAHVFHNFAFPGAYFALAIASAVLAIGAS
ncbi:DoxX family protein [Micromonospora sp. PPF5-17]|nr:DoxX family protein [Micromonospora sp. PPF5-17B]NES35174.1 DoxX family protein [Micromonospora solifontis]NES55169.1 DoxX family protein [Micromonospora sp. PPF5-6]